MDLPASGQGLDCQQLSLSDNIVNLNPIGYPRGSDLIR